MASGKISYKQAIENLFLREKGAKSHASSGPVRSEVFIGSTACLCGFQFGKIYQYIGKVRHNKFEHLAHASSSSVYGANIKMLFSTYDNVDHCVSLYVTSKKANELMAHTYSHLYNLSTTGLLFYSIRAVRSAG